MICEASYCNKQACSVLEDSHLNCRRSCPYQSSLRTDGRTLPKRFSAQKEREVVWRVCFICPLSLQIFMYKLSQIAQVQVLHVYDPIRNIPWPACSCRLACHCRPVVTYCMCTLQLNLAVPLMLFGKTFWPLQKRNCCTIVVPSVFFSFYVLS